MAWYDEALNKGFVVRGEVEQVSNSFPSYESWRVGGKGVNKVKNISDAYIQLSGKYRKDKIVCSTADIRYCKQHGYMLCSESYGTVMNTLRNYYIEKIGKREDICRIEKDNNGKDKNVWFNEKTIKSILEHTPLDVIDDHADGEIYIESTDLDFLCEIFLAKTQKKKKDPFHEDYLDWSNKYKLPENCKDDFSKIYKSICGDDGSMSGVKIIKETNDKFRLKHPRKLGKTNKRLSRIKDFKAFIHYCGYWDEYIKFVVDCT